MTMARLNHYVPIWYQRGFLKNNQQKLFYLDLSKINNTLQNNNRRKSNGIFLRPPKKCFCTNDLYTLSLFGIINDDIEKYLFGKIDDSGARAFRAFINNDYVSMQKRYTDFFEFIDAQKIRTPKGLDWIKSKYVNIDKANLLIEMQHIRRIHCAMFIESTKEIVTATKSQVKFIITDHPVTIYHKSCPPSSDLSVYPEEPPISLIGTQTIMALDQNHCLILTNTEYARDPESINILDKRINARFSGNTIVKTDEIISRRDLNKEEVIAINFILKSRARRFIASTDKRSLFPENYIQKNWKDFAKVLIPSTTTFSLKGPEIFIGYKDGTYGYQDEYGRTQKELPYLNKQTVVNTSRNDPCPCGSGKKYKKCCMGKATIDCPSVGKLGIRERNIKYYRMLINILGFTQDKTWDNIRREFNEEHVLHIYKAYQCLWPRETNTIDMLPRPDSRVSRVIYSGIIDVKLIIKNVLAMLPYFDEFYIVSPFVHPESIKKDSGISPLVNPEKYIDKTFNDIVLFFQIFPFIQSGYVNFLPNPLFFNYDLYMQLMKLAEKRKGDIEFNYNNSKQLIDYYDEYINRSFLGLPGKYLEDFINGVRPDLSPDDRKSLIKKLIKLRQDDPLAILRPTAIGKGNEQIFNMTLEPNFEFSLFLACSLGAIILTDNNFRWEEFNAFISNREVDSHTWSKLSDVMTNKEFLTCIDQDFCMKIRKENRLTALRIFFRRLISCLKDTPQSNNIIRLDSNLATEFELAYNSFRREWNNLNPDHLKIRKVQTLFPNSEFVANEIKRLLLIYGNQNYEHEVPLVLKIDE